MRQLLVRITSSFLGIHKVSVYWFIHMRCRNGAYGVFHFGAPEPISATPGAQLLIAYLIWGRPVVSRIHPKVASISSYLSRFKRLVGSPLFILIPYRSLSDSLSPTE